MRARSALVIITVTLCLYVNSAQARYPWSQPTYSVDSLKICVGCASMYEWLTAHALIHVNNWLHENPLRLRFALFHTPHAIEAQTFAQRVYYGSYPPGAVIPLYVMIETLALFAPDLRRDRALQLRLIISYNHAYHLLLVLVLAAIVYLMLRRTGCDELNATVMACTPAIVQYSNAHSLYWFNLIYSFDQAVLLPCALYVLLEQRRQDRPVSWRTRTAQALLAFYGTLTDWLFVFFVAVVYLLRLAEGKIAFPRSLLTGRRFLCSSGGFFLPSLLALAFWLYQVQHFSSFRMLGTKLVSRMGLDIPTFTLWMEALTSGMFHWPELGYGVSGVALLYFTFYCAVRLCLRRQNATEGGYQAANCYLLLFTPCLLHALFFVYHSWDHLLSALKFSLALSVLFVTLTYMVVRVNPARPLLRLKRRPIYTTTVLSLLATVIFGYVRSQEATRFFSLPDSSFVRTGNFIRTNTVWQDVVFSRTPIAPSVPPQMQSLTGRIVHVITNLDHVYQTVADITADFTIKIFYYPHYDRQEIDRLVQFLAAQDMPTSSVEDEEAGGLLAFDGKDFVRWYRKTTHRP